VRAPHPTAAWLFAFACFVVIGAGAARAQDEAEDDAGEAEAPAELERLLTLPDSKSYGVDRRGGLSRGEWRSRFTELNDALAGERKALAEAEAKLDEAAGSASNWQMAPVPGLEPSPDAPLDYQLRVAIRRHRSEIERLERKLKQLEIEANLAGVPAEWRS
jgi:hypothetical protein